MAAPLKTGISLPEIGYAAPRSGRAFSYSRSTSPLKRFQKSVSTPSGTLDQHEAGGRLHLKKCFKDTGEMGRLLDELQRMDIELSCRLEASARKSREKTDQEGRSKSKSPSPVSAGLVSMESYQEFVSLFISLLVQSKFVDISFTGALDPSHDRQDIIPSLITSKACPTLEIFRRVCVNPTLVASELPDSSNAATFKDIPVNQLARFCDVAVLQFLSKVTEHTNVDAVVWALEYTYKLLNCLKSSLNNLSSFGWYRAPPNRYRKPTVLTAPGGPARPSIEFLPPRVVLHAGSPPTVKGYWEQPLDPDTSQPAVRHRSSYSPPPIVVGGAAGDASSVSLPIVSVSDTGYDSTHTTQDHAADSSLDNKLRPSQISSGSRSPAVSPGRTRRSSAPLQHPTLEALADGGFDNKSQLSWDWSSGSNVAMPVQWAGQSSRSRSHSPDVQDSDSLEGVDDDTVQRLSVADQEHDRLSLAVAPSLDSILEEEEEEEDDGDDRPAEDTHPSPISDKPLSPTRLSTERESTVSPDGGRPQRLSTPSDERSSDEEVHRKPLDLNSAGDSERDFLLEVNICEELETFMNAEGRISLIALLSAIGNLPQAQEIWTENLCHSCLLLIQFCMNLGLSQAETDDRASSERDNSASAKRKKFQRKDNEAFVSHGAEKPHKVHSRILVDYSVNALIHCATSMFIGCTTWDQCRLTYRNLPGHNLLIQCHHKLIHYLRRLHHFHADFRHALTKFASTAPCRKVLQFLHVILQYCMHARDQVDSLFVSLVTSVLRIVVDRLGDLDLAECSIQNSIVVEACGFFQYAQSVFSQDIPMMPPFRHLHMYIHRVALSVLLPPHPPPQLLDTPTTEAPPTFPYSDEAPPTPPLSSVAASPEKTIMTMPRKRRSHPAIFVEQNRRRSDSVPSPTSSEIQPLQTKSPKRQFRRAPLKKQSTVRSDVSDERPLGELLESGEGGRRRQSEGSLRRWREALQRRRIRRMVVLMQCSEPGTIPDAGMLGSLIDLVDGTSVVSRSLVLLECALFVNKLRSGVQSVWLQHNEDGGHCVCMHLRKWGEAIGEKLRFIELKEREMIRRLRKEAEDGATIVLPEEPISLDVRDTQEEGDGDGDLTVSYAVKMAACILLLEITQFLNDPPSQFSPLTYSQGSMHRYGSMERNQSAASLHSSDAELIKPSYSLSPRDLRPTLSHQHSGNISFEDYEPQEGTGRYPSMDEGGATTSHSPRTRRVSVYLRVTSGSGNSSATPSRSGRKQTVAFKDVHIVGGPLGELRQPSTPSSGSPALRVRKQSLFTSHTSTGLHRPSVHMKRPRRPSLSGEVHAPKMSTAALSHRTQSVLRRKSTGTHLSLNVREPLAAEPTEQTVRPRLQSQMSTASAKSVSGATLGAHLNEGFSKLRRSAQRAFRRQLGRKKPEVHTPAGSPNLPQKKKLQRRMSMTGSVGQLAMEDRRKEYSWLDVVEHMVLVNALDPGACKRHRRACLDLVTAMELVYSSEGRDDRGIETQPTVSGKMPRSLSTLLAGFVFPSSTSSSSGAYVRQTSLPAAVQTATVHRKRPASAQRTVSLPMDSKIVTNAPKPASASNPVAMLTFSGIGCERFTSSFLMMTSSSEAASIQLFLEEEAATPKPVMAAREDEERRDYIRDTCAGLLHAPFSLLVHAAPILHATSFLTLKEVAWNTMLDDDRELARAAGAFFLLSCAKETSGSVRSFLEKVVLDREAKTLCEAIQKFSVLWQVRYDVWPRMAERAQKKFNMEDETDQGGQDQPSIGYSLPSHSLASSGRDMPVSPWDPVSLCPGNACADNPDKCFRPTHLAPILHEGDISLETRPYMVSGVSVTQEASNKPDNVYHWYGDVSEDATGTDLSDLQWEAVEPTLFPRSLFPLISFVISSLHPSYRKTTPTTSSPSAQSSSQLEAEIAECARQTVWTCMVEDPRLFFMPLLNQFNKLYKLVSNTSGRGTHSSIDHVLSEILEPLHRVILAFPVLPPRAAHFLFNNFVGIVMRHTDQPYVLSGRVIQSVLSLITLVAPSVQNLDAKALKGVLKKESCYTSIMTTARIRGVEKIVLKEDQRMRVYGVGEEMTFGDLIAAASNQTLSLDLLQRLCIVDESKNLPMLSSLVVQDHYSLPADGQYPIFALQANTWQDQNDQLFRYKMSEMMRVQLALRLLLTGPGVERGFKYSDFAQPNYRFLHSELVELNSFPRKALTSLVYEVGQTALKDRDLRTSDVLLKGSWVRFVLQLFKSVPSDYEWSNSMILFLNVINGSLLLHSEDLSVLRTCLAALLTATSRFPAVFKKDGYQMIVPTLVHVYALHVKNPLVTAGLKFVWGQFYWIDRNVFLLQVIAATATLMSEETSSLSSSTFLAGGSSRAFFQSQLGLGGEMAHGGHMLAVYDLLDSLNSDGRTPLFDSLNILGCCPQEQPAPPTSANQTVRPLALVLENHLTLQNLLYLCATLIPLNPEGLRGMQVLVFLDHMLPLFLKHLPPNLTGFSFSLLKSIVKGCEPITKPHAWRELLAARKQAEKGGGTAAPDSSRQTEAEEDSLPAAAQPARKTSVAQRIGRMILNPNRKDLAVTQEPSTTDPPQSAPPTKSHPQHSLRAPLVPLDQSTYLAGFKQQRIQDAHQRIFSLSRESLLSLSSKFVLHFASGGSEDGSGGNLRKDSSSQHSIDAPSLSLLTSIAKELLKQGVQTESVLQDRGLNSFMSDLLPNVEWTEAHFSAFGVILKRLLSYFKKLRESPNRAVVLVWTNLASFITGVTHCIQRHHSLVLGHEQHFKTIKALLETVVVVSTGSHQTSTPRGGRKHGHQNLLLDAPACFTEAVVGLATEMICISQSYPNPRFSFRISDLKRTVRERDEPVISRKIILPICIQLSIQGDRECLSPEDVESVLQGIDKKVENALKFAKSPHQHPCQYLNNSVTFFRGLKVVCCAFSDILTLRDWHRIASWVLSLAQRKIDASAAKKISTASMGGEIGSQAGGWLSRRSSASSVSGPTLLEVFVAFHDSLLDFFESFLLVYRTPLYSLLWSVLGTVAMQLTAAFQTAKADSPALCDRIHSCLNRCQCLPTDGTASSLTTSQHTLLTELRDELRHQDQPRQPKVSGVARSHTTLEKHQAKTAVARRRRSLLTNQLARIGESTVESEEEPHGSPRSKKTLASSRPTFLRLTEGGAEDTTEKKERAVSPLQSLDRLRKTFTRKKSSVQTLSPPTLSPAGPSVTKKRAPPLAQLRGIYGSSGFHADIEDSISPEATPKHSVSSLPEAEQYVISDSHGTKPQKESSKLVVCAEVHERTASPEKRVQVTSPFGGACSEVQSANQLSTSEAQETFQVTSDTDELLPSKRLSRREETERALDSGIRESVKYLYGGVESEESQC